MKLFAFLLALTSCMVAAGLFIEIASAYAVAILICVMIVLVMIIGTQAGHRADRR